MNAIRNVNIITDDSILENHRIIFGEEIIAIESESSLPSQHFDTTIDAGGRFLSAGFMDIHVHGLAGFDTMDKDGASLVAMSAHLPSTGVTAFLATTMTMDLERTQGTLRNIREAMSNAKGAEVLGCHLEGPFININAKGAHSPTYIMAQVSGAFAPYNDVIKIVTMAPELEGSLSFIRDCTKNNIIVSVGHTQASYDQTMSAIENGARLITHIFNAMPPLHHRNPGAVGAALDSDVYCELIADNIHVHPVLQRVLLKSKGAKKIILITDATMACLPEGVYELGRQRVTVQSDGVRLSSGTLAGSSLTLNKAIKNVMINMGLDVATAVGMATTNPAKLLGLQKKKGHIAVGMDADLTVFDTEMNIHYTYVRGRQAYRRGAHAHLCDREL